MILTNLWQHLSNPTLLDSIQRLFTTETFLLNDLKETNFELSANDPDENFRFITDTFIKIVKCHAPLKKKIWQRKSSPFYEQGT